MRNDFTAELEDLDRIDVKRIQNDPVNSRIVFGQSRIYLTNKQLLDLAMKIQEVINQIDRENREVDEQRLMVTRTDEELREFEGDRP